MNDFGVNLKGKVAVFKKTSFYRPGANRNTRSFLCEGGAGCDPKAPGRTITGHWVADGDRDTLNSYEFESYIDDKGNEIENPGFRMAHAYTPPITVQEPEEEPAPRPPKSVLVIGVKPDAEESLKQAVAVALTKEMDSLINEQPPAPPEVTTVTEDPTTNVILLHKEPAKSDGEIKISVGRGRKSNNALFTPEKVIELFKQGKRIVDIAVELGYERGQGQNRTRAVLKAAGLVT